MPISINIKSNIDTVKKRLTAIERKQIPFATAGTINDTLFDIRKQTVGVTGPKAFAVRNKRFLGVAMRVDKASKAKLAGVVYDRLGRASLGLHATGGTKTPRGNHIAIPGRSIADKRTARGVRKSLRPRAVLSKAGNPFASGSSGAAERRSGLCQWATSRDFFHR